MLNPPSAGTRLHRWLLAAFLGVAVASAARATPAPATLYTGAWVLTLADGAAVPTAPGHLLVSADGFVLAAGPGAEPPPDTVGLADARRVDLTGRIVLPGFVSGHSHLWQSAFRGIAPDGELYPWLNALHRTYGKFFVEGDFAAFTRHGALDQLRHGVTTTYNHSQSIGGSYDIYGEQLAASEALPQRFVFAWVNDRDADDATWEARLQPLLARAVPAPDRSLLAFAVNAIGVHSEGDLLRRELSLASRHGLGVQMHYLEASGAVESDRAKWPAIREAGGVGPARSFAHFIHPDAAMVKEAAEAGAAMIWNPLSNGRLGSGLSDIEGYLAAGLKVGMGVDGAASADISDPFENVRLGLYALRMRRQNSKGLQPVDVLRLHTLATARVLGVDRWVGSLEPRKFADFLIVNPAAPATGPVWDPAATVVFACSSSNVESVRVGGREVVSAGRVLGVDEAAVETEVAARVDALRVRTGK